MDELAPLSGIRVVEYASGVAAAYAGRLLAVMGAETVMVEPPDHSPLRREGPFIGADATTSALFSYLATGKRSVICDLETAAGRDDFDRLAARAHIVINDSPLSRRGSLGLAEEAMTRRHPDLVHVSVLPFGASGPKAEWLGSEITLIHAGGEGYLLPNGLSAELFPDRPPLKIAGHFAEMQGGIAAALAALSALWSGHGQFVDVSVQDANVAVGAFAIQRNGDGFVEHRSTRSFRYGGVIECKDGHIELLTLEERQWQGLVELMGSPDWARQDAMQDPAERSARGSFINGKIRAWARNETVSDLIDRAQKLGVPMAPYKTPDQILCGVHETARGLFSEVLLPGVGPLPIQSAPFRFASAPLPVGAPPPAPGADQSIIGDRGRNVPTRRGEGS